MNQRTVTAALIMQQGSKSKNHSMVEWQIRSKKWGVPSAMREQLDALVQDIWKIVKNGADRLVSLRQPTALYLIEMLEADREGALERFGLNRRRPTDYRSLADTRKGGLVMDIGCEEGGILSIDEIRGPLLIIDKDPLVAMLLRAYAARCGRTDIEVVEADFRDVKRPGQAAGVNINGMLHSLPTVEIVEAVHVAVGYLEPGGILQTADAQLWCCPDASPEKIDAIRRAMGAVPGALLEERVDTGRIPVLGSWQETEYVTFTLQLDG